MIQLFEYKESPIQFELIEGQLMANATLMCKANGKLFADFVRLKQTQIIIDAICDRYGISHNAIVVQKQGGLNQGSWIHERLILPLARWLSVDFELWCDERLAELLRTGVTSIDGNLSKVIDAITSLVGAVTTMRSEVDDLKNAKKIAQKASSVENQTTGFIDARHRTYQTTEINGSQVRCIKLEDKNYYLMADVLILKGCRTSTGQYAATLNRSGAKMAVKIWLFAQPREAWFVSEDGLNLLLSK